MPATKIATCCYCGTRAALTLRGEVQHELACASCGAPLHTLKRIPREQAPERPVRTAVGGPRRRKPGKRKSKPLSRKLWNAAYDLLDDLLD